jgi:hypothetical protein
MSKILILCCFFLVFLGGCNSGIWGFGGKAAVKTEYITHIQHPDGKKETEVRRFESTVDQPDNPQSGGAILYDNKTGNITAQTGSARDSVKTIASTNLLKIPMYAGIGMIIAGVLVGAFLRNFKWGITLAASGFAMVVASFLLAQYAIYFMGLFAVFVAYLGYLMFDYTRSRRAAEEIVETNEILKSTNMIDKEKLAKVADQVQSKSTKKMIRKIKDDA